MRDATYVLDAMYGVDDRDNYTLAQIGKTPQGGYAQFLSDKSVLQGAVFGLPWASFWALNDPGQNADLLELVNLIKGAGATIINGTEFPDYKVSGPCAFVWSVRWRRVNTGRGVYTDRGNLNGNRRLSVPMGGIGTMEAREVIPMKANIPWSRSM
jgi:amidase